MTDHKVTLTFTVKADIAHYAIALVTLLENPNYCADSMVDEVISALPFLVDQLGTIKVEDLDRNDIEEYKRKIYYALHPDRRPQ